MVYPAVLPVPHENNHKWFHFSDLAPNPVADQNLPSFLGHSIFYDDNNICSILGF